MATTYIVDKDGNQIDAASATVPSDRHFRGAWSLSCLLYTSPSPRDGLLSRMPSSA